MKHFAIAMVFLACSLGAAAQTSQPQSAPTQSFGKRVPTLEEVRQAFAPKSSSLMSMGGAPVKRAIDFELLFAFASAELTPQARQQLAPVGEFLQAAELKDGAFLIEGHTDATGAEPANQALSARRALAVKNYLVSQYKLAPAIFATAGKGSSELKDTANPAADINRRVEFSMFVSE